MHTQSFARIRVYGDFQQIAARKFRSYLNNKDESIDFSIWEKLSKKNCGIY